MHEHTSAEDAVKGQSLMLLASSAAGLLSSFSGGFMIDRLGVRAFLTVCVVMAVLGTLIVFAAVGKEQNA
jgi:predicted MFS family arabinose efflux permease